MTPPTRTVFLGLLVALMPCLASCAPILGVVLGVAEWLGTNNEHIGSIDHIDQREYTFDVSLPSEPHWGMRMHIEYPAFQKELSEVRWTLSVEMPGGYEVGGVTPGGIINYNPGPDGKFIIYDGPMADFWPATGQIGLRGGNFDVSKSRAKEGPYRFLIRLRFDRTLKLQKSLRIDARHCPPMTL